MTTTVRIPVHLRDEAISANDRPHWTEKAERTSSLRTKSWAFHRPWIKSLIDTIESSPKVHLTVWVTWPDRRHRDVDNLAPTIKAMIDGVRDALEPLIDWDDDDTHLVGPDKRVDDHVTDMPGMAYLTFVWEGL